MIEQVFTKDLTLTLSVLKQMIDDGDIIPNPDYQRDYVFNDRQASRLIESILMGIPIPTIFYAQEDDETFSVIDGQQRMLSVKRFLENDFRLTGLEEIPELNGMKYQQLERQVQKRLKTSSLTGIALLKESASLKYEIFARLNVGSVKLKPQELRNCVYRGTFNTLIEEIAEKNKLLPLLFHDDNKRKEYQERILRFFALRNYLDYRSSLSKTMNEFMAAHRNPSEEELIGFKKLFEGTIDTIKQILGEDAFSAWDRQKKQMLAKFSGSVYDSIVIPLSRMDKHELIKHAAEIADAIKALKVDNPKYQEYTYAATGSRKRVIGRIDMVYQKVSEIIGGCGTMEARVFSPDVKKQLWKDGLLCPMCGNPILSIDDAEVDHIVPFSLGGETTLANAQLLHRHCNRVKSDSTSAHSDLWEDSSDAE